MSRGTKAAARILKAATANAVAGTTVAAVALPALPEKLHAGALLSAGALAAMSGGVKEAAAMLLDMMKHPDTRLNAAVTSEHSEAVEAVGPAIEAKIEALLESGKADETVASDAAAILVAWQGPWRTATSAKKRRLLMAALLSAFDPEVYEEGLTSTLLGILETLDYGDLWTLRRLNRGSDPRLEPDGLEHFFLDRLAEAHLLIGPGRYKPTELGRRMLRLLEKGWPADPDVEESQR